MIVILKRKLAPCLLVILLLTLGLAGQGVAALEMACKGTASCCCQTDAAMPADMGPMGGGCCQAPAARPCDLAVPVSSPTDPFLPANNNPGPEASAALVDPIPLSDAAAQGGSSSSVVFRPPFLTGPPVYLLTQTFLC